MQKKYKISYLSDTSVRGLTIFCQTPIPFLLSKCQIFLLCSFPVLFSTRTKETSPSKNPWRSHDIRSYKGRISTQAIKTKNTKGAISELYLQIIWKSFWPLFRARMHCGVMYPLPPKIFSTSILVNFYKHAA